MYFMIARGLYLKRTYWTTLWDIKASSTNFLSFFTKEYFVKINSAQVFHGVLFFLITARAQINKVKDIQLSYWAYIHLGISWVIFWFPVSKISSNLPLENWWIVYALNVKKWYIPTSWASFDNLGFFLIVIIMVNVFSFTAKRKLHLWQFCKLLHIRKCIQIDSQ